MSFIQEVIAIIIGVAIVDALFEFIKYLYNRWSYRELDEATCDNCETLHRKLYRTPDKYYYLCKSCCEIYLENTELGFTEEQKAKVRSKYRTNKKNKRRSK